MGRAADDEGGPGAGNEAVVVEHFMAMIGTLTPRGQIHCGVRLGVLPSPRDGRTRPQSLFSLSTRLVCLHRLRHLLRDEA